MREASAIMADLAGAGLTPEQLALVMELTLAVATEARPVVDATAEERLSESAARMRRKRERDRHKASQSVTCDVTCDGDVTQKETLPLVPLEPPLTPTREKISRTRKGRVTCDGAGGDADVGGGEDLPAPRGGKAGGGRSGSTVPAGSPDGSPGGGLHMSFAKPGEAAICADVRAAVCDAVGPETYRSWLDPGGWQVADGWVRIVADTRVRAEHIRNNLIFAVQRAAGRVMGQGVKVEVVTGG